MKNTSCFFLFGLLILLQTACSKDFFETVIPLDLPNDGDRITLNCLTDTEQSRWTIKLTRSISTLEDNQTFPRITDANIELFANGTATGSFLYDTVSYYSNGDEAWYIDSAYVAYQFAPIAGQAKPPYLLPQAGINYTLKATAPNLPPAQASMTIPPPVPIQTITVGEKLLLDNEYYYPVDITFQDPNNSNDEENYYFLSVRQYIDPIIDPVSGIETDTIEICNCFYSRRGGFFDQNQSFFNTSTNELVRTNGREPFTNQLFVGKQHTLQIFVPVTSFYDLYGQGSQQYQAPTTKFRIILGTQNKERYFYRESRGLQSQTENNPFAEPATVYNNIDGGFGIFGGYSSNTKTITLP